ILWFFPPLLLIFLITGWFWQSKRRQLAARGDTNKMIDTPATALTPAEKAELDRLLSRSHSTDHDVTSTEDKK
ncbi:cytochrome c-type biogenesis protein CcmH, partial [Psychrobacter sp. 1U2]